MKLKDRVAIVTGTSPNIGGGIAEALAAEGAIVVAVDAVAANAEQCAAYLEAQGGRAKAICCDVSDEAAVEAAVSAALADFDRIDILVNNAAYFNAKGVLDMPIAEWRAQLSCILDGSFLFTKYVAKAMIERQTRGAMINLISTAGHQGEPRNVAYSTGKCGLLNFTRSVAMELASHGIRVNSLTPTATDPREQVERAARWGRTMTLPVNIAAIMKPFEDGIPLGKLPRPSDYGKAVVYLVSDDAEMVTGTDLRIDAGAIAKYWAWTPPIEG